MGYRWMTRVALFAFIAPLVIACTERQPVSGAGNLPVEPTAFPSPTGGLRVARPSEDIQDLDIVIENGEFTADRYTAQSRAIRMEVTAEGGPYTFSIDQLVGARVLAPDTTTEIALTVPDPGDYTVRVTGPREDTAVLNVRPPGGR